MSAHTLTNLLGSTPSSTGAGTGDVVGPSSSTDNAIARYDSTTGKLLQGSTAILNDGTLSNASGTGVFLDLPVTVSTTGTGGWTGLRFIATASTDTGSGTKLLMQLGTGASASLVTASNTGAVFANLGFGHGTGVANGTVMFNSIQSLAGIAGGQIVNTNTGISASARWVLSQGDADVTNGVQLRVTSTGFTASGLFAQDAAMLIAGSGLAGGLTIGTQASASLIFATNDTNRGSIDSSGNWSLTGTLADVTGNVRAADVSGTFTVPITTNPLAMAAADSYGFALCYGATGEIDLPAGVAGMNGIIYNTGSFTITIDPNGSEVVVRDGTAQTGGVSFTLSSGAGNYVALYFNGTQWITTGYKGTLAEGS